MPYKDKQKQKEYDKAYLESHRDVAKERSSNWYYNNKEKATKRNVENQRKRSVKDRAENPKLYMLRRTKNSALTRKLECTITVDDFEIPEVCPILGIPLVLHAGIARDNSPSMGRIDNNRGYVPGNVCVISKAANRMKSDLTLEILDKLREYVFNQKRELSI